MSTDRDAYLAYCEAEKERLIILAEKGEKFRRRGCHPIPPPLEMATYPDLWERAWGWDTILPYQTGHCWPIFKEYLHEFYRRNNPGMEANASGILNGNGLATLADLCMKMEVELVSLLKNREVDLTPLLNSYDEEFDRDYISLSNKVSSCVHQMINVDCCEFPIATFALKVCVMADLMCELMRDTKLTIDLIVSNGIRKRALSFMTYKGPECVAAAATMMAAIKETKIMCALMRNEREDENGDYFRRNFLQNRILAAMAKLCDECSVAEECTQGNTAGKLIIVESDGKDCSEINEKPKKTCSRDELAKEIHQEEGSGVKQNNKGESHVKSGSEIGAAEENYLESNKTKEKPKIGTRESEKQNIGLQTSREIAPPSKSDDKDSSEVGVLTNGNQMGQHMPKLKDLIAIASPTEKFGKENLSPYEKKTSAEMDKMASAESKGQSTIKCLVFTASIKLKQAFMAEAEASDDGEARTAGRQRRRRGWRMEDGEGGGGRAEGVGCREDYAVRVHKFAAMWYLIRVMPFLGNDVKRHARRI
ncbi:hypothetical protein ACP70R_050021 [Stipagrostis hirtigluma subsp. patula]